MSEIHHGHRDRLKEQFLQTGLEGFPDHVKLELLLFFAIPRIDTNELGHRLIKYFGSLSAVLDAPYDELLKLEGVGPNAALIIKLIPQFAAAYMEDQAKDIEILDTAEKAGTYLVPKFMGRTNEVVYIVSLTSQRKVISCRLVHEGSINSAEISMRRIVEVCVQTNASSVIVAHNHPNGAPLPSGNDLQTSIQITKTLKSIGVEILDHIIVAGTEFTSIGKCDEFFDNIQKW